MLLVMNLRRETPQKTTTKKNILSMGSGMNCKLEENSRMTGVIITIKLDVIS